ncbi:metallo-beta-lactamase superfamily protein [Penicillium nucicola]|uniref:metallo-beta-lactamase superfamily protein n=1 Tax=Penicillium nucicola TaxID=1850975 RepID=UPI002545601F|nr:metallo-beta-lactamase superfamily protein [Penicillium nucicola]KAJ5754138.1 metallo-beta-lactamase superfamily protein [Penicillium nucicola]
MASSLDLQVDVYVAPPIPTTSGSDDPTKQWWSPISCTLIHGPTSAVLVDTPISIKQTEALAAWIKQTAPGKQLKYIYTTHAHGDHYFGNPVILKHFPEATSVTTSLVATGIRDTLASAIPRWKGWFPNGQILSEGHIIPDSLPETGEFSIDGHSLFGINVAHSDTDASSFLHVPDLKLVVAGDIVYGDCFQFLAEAKTADKRKDWLDALDQIAALEPNIVVPGHKRATQVDGPYLIEATKGYIVAFEEELERLGDVDKVEQAMTKRYPQRWNRFILEMSCKSSVAALKL